MVLTFGIGVFMITLFSKVVQLEAIGRTSTKLGLLITISIPHGQIIFGFLYDTFASSYGIILSGISMFLARLIFRKPLANATEKILKQKL